MTPTLFGGIALESWQGNCQAVQVGYQPLSADRIHGIHDECAVGILDCGSSQAHLLAGKTSFIDSIGEENEALQKQRFRFAAANLRQTISLDDVTLFLLTPPGVRRFDFMWERWQAGV